MPFLVAADADRVQDLIFRSSRLREVVGGSHALEGFWMRAAALAQEKGGRVVVSAGGTFRVLFDQGPAADDFGRDLLDVYAAQVGGGLTLVRAEGDDERALLDTAGGALAAEKMRGDPPAASIHFPYLQPCQSCARDLALNRVPVGGGETQDLCAVCAERRGLRDDFQKIFLPQVQDISLDSSEGDRARIAALRELPEDADEVGAYDSRGRVAYLLADGNGFGRLFGRAAAASGSLADDESVYRDLSRAVGEAGSHALAVATARLVAALPAKGAGDRAPVLPLIAGGDDVFALLPAPWAVRFAEWFAEAMAAHVGAAKIFEEVGLPPPTVSCALVFCKATFPYRFAHGVGERALKEAKAASRTRAGESLLRMTELRSMVAPTDLGPRGEHGVFRIGAAGAGSLSTGDLLAARGTLDGLPGKRRHQIEGLYGARDDDSLGWVDRRTRLLERAGSVRAGGVEALLATLEPEGSGGAIPDLLHLWDYLVTPEGGAR